MGQAASGGRDEDHGAAASGGYRLTACGDIELGKQRLKVDSLHGTYGPEGIPRYKSHLHHGLLRSAAAFSASPIPAKQFYTELNHLFCRLGNVENTPFGPNGRRSS